VAAILSTANHIDKIVFIAHRLGTKVLQNYVHAAYQQVATMDSKKSIDDANKQLRRLSVVLDLFDDPPHQYWTVVQSCHANYRC